MLGKVRANAANHSNRFVAMARLHDDATEAQFDPFIREARLTALLEHPNVITVHDVGVDEDGEPYFTMELKVGDGLDAVLGRDEMCYSMCSSRPEEGGAEEQENARKASSTGS